MSIKNMHYDFKQKLNKIDSNAYVNLQIPEIDRKLNEAQLLYVLLIAEPRFKNQLGFETSQRSIDDILPVVKDDILAQSGTAIDGAATYALPDDYMFYLSTSLLLLSKDTCEGERCTTNVIRHNDENERRDFYKSNFDWRECNMMFIADNVKLYVPTGCTVNIFSISYIKTLPYIQNAEEFEGGIYNLPGGESYTGHQDSILPQHTHKEIVDIAVMLTTGDLEMPLAAQFKQGLLKTKQLL